MQTITYQHAQDLIRQANDTLRASTAPSLGNVRAVEIVDSGFGGFNPTLSWLGACSNSPETAMAFAEAVKLAAELVEAMPLKGAQVTC